MAKPETRQKILKAAENLFAVNGYNGVPTKLIAQEAGITEMTLFNHFKSKGLLYKTVVKERYLAIEIESVFTELTFNDREADLERISLELIRNFFENKKILMMRLKETQNFKGDEVFSIENDPLIKQITPVFEVYAEKGMLRDSGEKAARIFMVPFKGICHLFLLEDKKEEFVISRVKEYIHSICHGLKS